MPEVDDMGLKDVLAAIYRWLHMNGSISTKDYRIVIDVPTVCDEAALRLALKNEFESAVGYFDLDKPLRVMGFDVEFKWPS